MKILLQFIGLTFGVLALTGCEWTAGSGVDSWDDSGNWVDFSGSYKAADGNVLVRQFGPTNTAYTTTTNYTTNAVSGELLAMGDGTNTVFDSIPLNKPLGHTPVRGSLTITAGGFVFTDIGSAGTTDDTYWFEVNVQDGTTGKITYSTRAWFLKFSGSLDNNTPIWARYSYISSTEVIVPGQGTNATPVQGNHGNAIYSFVVYQTGNKLQLTDSNGAKYEGAMGTVRTTGGKVIDANDSTTVLPTSGPVVAQFSATGVSQGYKVTLVGVLQGTLTSATTMSSRSMKATFIEEAGSEADVSAVAGQ